MVQSSYSRAVVLSIFNTSMRPYWYCNRLPRLALPYDSPPVSWHRMSHYLCLTTYFHYLLPTVSAVYLGNCTSSSSSFCYPLRVYIDALELHLQSSRSFNSSHCKAYSYEPGSHHLLTNQSTTLFKKSLLLPLQCLELLHLLNERTIDPSWRTYPTNERTDESNQKFETSK